MTHPPDAQQSVGDPYEVGRTVARRYTFTAENIKAYAEMAGDTNPLHHDAEFAARSKFGTLIAAAAHSTGTLISVAADKFSPNGEAVGLGFSLTLRRAVKAGTETDLIWEVTGKEWSEKLKGTIVELAGEIRDVEHSLPLLIAKGSMLVLPTPASNPEDSAS